LRQFRQQIDAGLQRRPNQVDHDPVFQQQIAVPLSEIHDVPAPFIACQ
jgi:hypothetical protein